MEGPQRRTMCSAGPIASAIASFLPALSCLQNDFSQVTEVALLPLGKVREQSTHRPLPGMLRQNPAEAAGLFLEGLREKQRRVSAQRAFTEAFAQRRQVPLNKRESVIRRPTQQRVLGQQILLSFHF